MSVPRARVVDPERVVPEALEHLLAEPEGRLTRDFELLPRLAALSGDGDGATPGGTK